MSSKKSNKRGLGKSLSDLGLAALLGGDWNKSGPGQLEPSNRAASSDSTDGAGSGMDSQSGQDHQAGQSQDATIESSVLPAAGELTESLSSTSTGCEPPESSLSTAGELESSGSDIAESSESLIAPASQAQGSGLLAVDIERLQPGRYQPRRHMNDDSLQELAQSIAQQGIIQPIVVRILEGDASEKEATYEIVAGERRWRAAKIAALKQVPVVVHTLNDRDTLAIALIENLQREDLNAVDQAIALQRMLNEFDLTHLEVAEVVGKSRTTISNLLRLLNLHIDVQKLIQQGDLEMGHGRALLALPLELQPQQAEDIISRSLTVRQTEQLMQSRNKNKQVAPDLMALNPELKLQLERMQKRLSQSLDCKVMIQNKNNKRGNGKLTLHYKDQQQLEAMIAKLEGNA